MAAAVLYSPTVNRILLASACLLYLGLTVLFSVHKLRPPTIDNLYTYQCLINEMNAGKTLHIRNVISNLSMELANQLCTSEILAAQGYSQVEISWPPSGQITAKALMAQEYDFLLNRQHNLQGLLNEVDELYKPVLDYPMHPIFWWSKTATPQLSEAFFRNKRIGVSSNTESHPYYLIPLKSLSDAGIELTDEQLLIVPTPDSLLQAFAENHVDMIMGSQFIPEQLKNYPHDYPLYRSKQSWEVASSTWFVSHKLSGSKAVICEFIRAGSLYEKKMEGYNLKAIAHVDC